MLSYEIEQTLQRSYLNYKTICSHGDCLLIDCCLALASNYFSYIHTSRISLLKINHVGKQ
jgi:hypothetical protein